MKDVYYEIFPSVSLPIARRQASENGTGVDLKGYDAALIEFVSGEYTGGTHVFDLKDSTDNSTFAAVTSGQFNGALPTIAASGNGWNSQKVAYMNGKRYVRVDVTVSALGLATYGATVLRMKKRHNPTA